MASPCVSPLRLPPLVLLLLAFGQGILGAQVAAPAPWEVKEYRGVPLESGSPSIVVAKTDDKDLAVGSFDLAPAPGGVVDGDTLRVVGLKESLRLVGLDAEETFKDPGLKALAARDWSEYLKSVYAGKNPARPPKFGSPLGEAAKAFANGFFAGVKTVHLELDEKSKVLDYYGRHLVHVLAEKDGRLVNYNVELVRQGLSPYFVKYGKSARFDAAFAAAEKEAREAKRGIFGVPAPYPCYPDYELRFAWWNEREADIREAYARRAKGEDLLVLGEEGAWESLRAKVGGKATVVTTPGEFRERGGKGLQALGHKSGRDVMVVGTVEQVKALGFDREEGNILLVSGMVTLYKDQPQFDAATVSFRRVRAKP